MTLHLGEDNAERESPVSPVLAQPQPCKSLLTAVKYEAILLWATRQQRRHVSLWPDPASRRVLDRPWNPISYVILASGRNHEQVLARRNGVNGINQHSQSHCRAAFSAKCDCALVSIGHSALQTAIPVDLVPGHSGQATIPFLVPQGETRPTSSFTVFYALSLPDHRLVSSASVGRVPAPCSTLVWLRAVMGISS